MAALALSLLMSVTVQPTPAAAYTPTENFIRQVYADFLLRQPTSNELSWWTAYLGGGSRAQMVAGVLDTSEFSNLWVAGTGAYYLGGSPANASTLASNLDASGDYVATEISIMASTQFFDSYGGSNSGFVTAVYSRVLLRYPSDTDLTYWVDQLDSAAKTRTQVANFFVKSSEGSTRRVAGRSGQTACSATELTATEAVAAGSYCIVLDRLGDASGVGYWTTQLTGSGQLPDLWASLAGSTEYFNNAQ